MKLIVLFYMKNTLKLVQKYLFFLEFISEYIKYNLINDLRWKYILTVFDRDKLLMGFLIFF